MIEYSLETLPPEIGQLVNLTNLHLDTLAVLPAEIRKLKNLTRIKLTYDLDHGDLYHYGVSDKISLGSYLKSTGKQLGIIQLVGE